MRSLDSKIAEIIGRQERMLTLISSNQQQQQQQQPVGGQQQQPQAVVDTFRRDEVNHLMNQQNDLVKTVRDIYASVTEVQRKTNFLSDQANLKTNQQQQQHQQPASGGGLDVALAQQINENIKTLKYEIASQTAKVSNQNQYII